MLNNDLLLSAPIEKLKDWTFDEHVAIVFQDMIQRSVPGYSNIISIIGILAKCFTQDYTNIYDLGCSLGAATLSVHKHIKAYGCNIIAVDNSSAMIKRCLQHIKSCSNIPPPINIIEDDIRQITIENASLVILNFTLQFLALEDRQQLLNNIFKGLLPNGVLFLSEKFSFTDFELEKLLYNMHYEFKRNNGYSDLQIFQKRNMLKNVMLTDSVGVHKKRLKKAGFKYSAILFQYFNFGSLIALKGSKV